MAGTNRCTVSTTLNRDPVALAILRAPLVVAERALGRFPLLRQHGMEEIVVPRRTFGWKEHL